MELTVSKVNEYIKNMFEYEPGLNNISVKGEVSNCKYHTSGHIYFTLKDNNAQLSCVMFYNARAGLKFKLMSGQSVIVNGKITVYERDGKFQMYARQIEMDGVGSLHEKFEKLKAKLASEGLFNVEHKKKIPTYAKKVGIVTATGAAALQDIINISKRRNPYVELILCPVTVQGEKAAVSIAEGIRKMDEQGVDVIIVGRGGGSIEDLWAFNEEIVARACYECNTPIISAVGHETDTTIIDFVSDLRAPTPSAAAELAVFDYKEFIDRCNDLKSLLNSRMNAGILLTKKKYENLHIRLKHSSPQGRLDSYKQRADQMSDRLDNCIDTGVRNAKHKVALFAMRLEGVSPIKKLSEGYSYTTDESGRNISSVHDVKKGQQVNVLLADGSFKAEVIEV